MWSINFSTKTVRRLLGTSLQLFPGGVSFIHCNAGFEVIVGPPLIPCCTPAVSQLNVCHFAALS